MLFILVTLVRVVVRDDTLLYESGPVVLMEPELLFPPLALVFKGVELVLGVLLTVNCSDIPLVLVAEPVLTPPAVVL